MRVSVTLLEAFRRFQRDRVGEKEFINQLMGVYVPNRAMSIGSAFHSLLEKKYDGELPISVVEGVEYYKLKGFSFNKHQFDVIIDKIDYDGGIEIKTTKRYNVEGENVTLVGKADYVIGNKVIDFKTTSYFKFDNYYESLQWRCYLDLFQSKEFEYWAYALKEVSDGLLYISDSHYINLRSYSQLRNDIMNTLKEFVLYVKNNNLRQYLEK